MRMRSMLAAFGAALTLVAGVAAPASATHRVISQEECDRSVDFVQFFRNNSQTDKYCYAGENPQSGTTLSVRLTGVTWFNSGVNYGEISFRDQHGTRFDKSFSSLLHTGCDYCTIDSIRIIRSD
ncbi:hypothetical protein [Lentzea sp. NPDC092896]|uniref:hypothetical protein n=1 Tax=Lentzea sp. NPDC092896 TaxID=3364127 RepID=UPI0037FE60EB